MSAGFRGYFARKQKSKTKRSFLPEFMELEDRSVPSATITAGINGINNTGWYPPNVQPAVGPNYIVETLNENLAIFNKSTGTLVSSQSLSSLFTGFDQAGSYGIFDPSSFYDEQAGRFVIEAHVADQTAHKAYVDIAISNSSDPTQGFSERHQIEVDQGGVYWADNGKIGWNTDAYVYSGNLYTWAGSFGGEIVVSIAKSSVLDQNSSTLTDTLINRPTDGPMAPARMHGSTTGGPMYFLETSWSGGSSIAVLRMSNVLSSSPTFTTTNVSVNSYGYLSSAPQPGGSLTIGDSRTLNVEWYNNNLVVAYNSKVGTDAAAAWAEFNTSGSSPTLVQQGVIHPGTGISTYFPAVAVDANGNIGLNYLESSTTEPVSMYVTGRLASDPLGTMESPVLAKAGSGTLSPGRAGDYGGMALDPSTSGVFWAANEYSAGGPWGTWLASFQLGSSSGGTSGTTSSPPTVASPASASPSLVTGTTTNLSVLGADVNGESTLTYTWSATTVPTGASAPSFSINGTNAAKNTTATFAMAGNYTFQVVITDQAGLSVTSSVNVTVQQTFTSISVTPGSVTLKNGATQQFSATARDQFGLAMATQPASFTWSLASGSVGSVSSTGLYTAPTSGTGTATVQAGSGTLVGSASVTVSTVPAAPVLSAAATASNRVNLTWTESSTNVTGFILQRSSDGGTTWSQIAQLSASSTSYTDRNVSGGKTYQYRILATSAVGNSAWSNVASTTTPASSSPKKQPPKQGPATLAPSEQVSQGPALPNVGANTSAQQILVADFGAFSQGRPFDIRSAVTTLTQRHPEEVAGLDALFTSLARENADNETVLDVLTSVS
jgi:hypothetical protein